MSSRFSYEGLNKVIHERARLGILTSLMTNRGGLSFVELKKLCDLTDGNLSRHIKVLSEAGFVTVEKSFKANRPHTRCDITKAGREAFSAYIEVLESVVKDAAVTPESDGFSRPKST